MFCWRSPDVPLVVVFDHQLVEHHELPREDWIPACSAASKSCGTLFPKTVGKMTETSETWPLREQRSLLTLISISPRSSSSNDPAWRRISAVHWDTWIFRAVGNIPTWMAGRSKPATKVLKEEFSAGPSPLVQLILDPRDSINCCNQHKTCKFLPENILKTAFWGTAWLWMRVTIFPFPFLAAGLLFGSCSVLINLGTESFPGRCSGGHNHTAQTFNFPFKVSLTRAVTFHAWCHVDRVAKQTVARHSSSHHSGDHGTCGAHNISDLFPV